MRVLVLVAAACGGSTPPAKPAPLVGPPQVAWKDLSGQQRARFMAKVVMPKFAPRFHAFDAKTFEKFACVTCHGPGVADHTYQLPNPELYVLPETIEEFKQLFVDKPEWMHFMTELERDMATTLGMQPADPAHPQAGWSGCYTCHSHRPGGQDAH